MFSPCLREGSSKFRTICCACMETLAPALGDEHVWEEEPMFSPCGLDHKRALFEAFQGASAEAGDIAHFPSYCSLLTVFLWFELKCLVALQGGHADNNMMMMEDCMTWLFFGCCRVSICPSDIVPRPPIPKRRPLMLTARPASATVVSAIAPLSCGQVSPVMWPQCLDVSPHMDATMTLRESLGVLHMLLYYMCTCVRRCRHANTLMD